MIDESDVRRLALLARVALDDDEAAALQRDCAAILAYVSELERVAAAEGENEDGGPLRNVLREDAAPRESGSYTEALLSAAPVRQGNYIRVKKILGE